jgi:hypothetical protein
MAGELLTLSCPFLLGQYLTDARERHPVARRPEGGFEALAGTEAAASVSTPQPLITTVAGLSSSHPLCLGTAFFATARSVM